MRTLEKRSAQMSLEMQSLSKQVILDRLHFVEQQIDFILETTKDVHIYQDFMTSLDRVVLFNSTCMCLQTIGETIKKIDDYTKGKLFSQYPGTPWKKVIGMRNIISHEYMSVDPQIIFETVKKQMIPLLDSIHEVIKDFQ